MSGNVPTFTKSERENAKNEVCDNFQKMGEKSLGEKMRRKG
jgi:hypothetical protein